MISELYRDPPTTKRIIAATDLAGEPCIDEGKEADYLKVHDIELKAIKDPILCALNNRNGARLSLTLPSGEHLRSIRWVLHHKHRPYRGGW